MQKFGLVCQQQKKISVYYDNYRVGEYFADIVVNNVVILELKVAKSIAPDHEIQLMNYLKATEVEVGYVMVFGEQPQFKRILFTNDRKQIRRAA
jgi:GxxExxY protein